MASLTPQWIRQIGSASFDNVFALTLEPTGYVFIGGNTNGQLGTDPNAGSADAFLARYDAKGEQLWLKQIGSDQYDKISALQADTRRAIFAAGSTSGQLGDQPNQGQGDALVIKYDTLGNLQWLKQLGTQASESIQALGVDQAGNIYFAGSTNGTVDGSPSDGSIIGFIGKLDPAGNQVWLKSLASFSMAYAVALSVDKKGNIYVAGYSEGDFDREADSVRSDGIIVKYNPNGESLWSQRIGYEFSDGIHAIVCSPQGNLYVGGFIMEKIGPEPQDIKDQAFIGKYNTLGEQVWLRELDQTDFDWIMSLDVDAKEHVYVGGYIRGRSADNDDFRDTDAFMAKYTPDGDQLWLHQFGTPEADGIQALAVDRMGQIYVAGYTSGQIGADRPKGSRDIFLAKYIQPAIQPIPSTSEPMLFVPPTTPPINLIPVERPAFSEILPVQSKTVLDFLNQAKTAEDLTEIERYRPDLSKEVLASYSIGPQGAQNLLDARDALPAKQFNSLEEVLAVKAIGEDKVLDIIEFIWLPTEEIFRQELFRQVLGGNWVVDYWRYPMSQEAYERLEENSSLLQDFVASKIQDIARQRTDNFVIGSLAKALLRTTFPDRVESLTALTQFASWWFRFDEDNWFSFERISEVIDPFLNYYNRGRATYIDPVFYRGFQNGGTVADGITPDDLVVTLNPAEMAVTIWGISLFD